MNLIKNILNSNLAYGRFYPLGDMLLSPAQRKAAEDVGKGGLLTR